jgi:hypothetical protein
MTQEQFYREQRQQMVSNESCNIVVRENAIKFANWIARENYKKVDVYEQSNTSYCYRRWINKIGVSSITTGSLTPSFTDEELFNEFIKSL